MTGRDGITAHGLDVALLAEALERAAGVSMNAVKFGFSVTPGAARSAWARRWREAEQLGYDRSGSGTPPRSSASRG